MYYFIATYGCQANKADSERIAGRLEKSGHKKTGKIEKADIVVINACSVRQSAMDRVYGKVRNFTNLKNKKSNLKIIVTGCLLEPDKRKLKQEVDEIWNPEEYFNCKPIYSDKTAAYVPIMTGCDNFCSYCAVPHTRGREKSRQAGEIIAEVKKLIKNGCKEIWLLGQNVNSYQDDTGNAFFNSRRGRAKLKFPVLLKAINNLPENFKINFLTSHPKDMSDELIKTIAECEKVSKEIHLPLQSGDNAVLKKMNRKYTIGYYKNLVKKIRRKIPEAKISTDIIVGFPDETKKQFKNTAKAMSEIGFSKAYIACYSPRPSTLAAKLKDNVSRQEKKERKRILEKIIEHE